MKQKLLYIVLTVALIGLLFQTGCKNGEDSTSDNVTYTLSERLSSHQYPKLANQLMSYVAEEPIFSSVYYWDLVIVDVEIVANNPEYIGENGTLRQNNPYIVVLGYFSPVDVILGNTSQINGGFITGLQDNWYFKDINGNRYKFFLIETTWTEMLNLSTGVNSYTPTYLQSNVVSKQLLDGIFYDWINTDWSWLNYRTDTPSARPDVDNDGQPDSDTKLNNLLNTGTQTLLQNSRNQFTSGTLLMGNGGWITGSDHDQYLNGVMIEDFLGGEQLSDDFGWGALMRSHYQHTTQCQSPNTSFIMANGEQGNFKFMRFAMASALMFNGYYCYTNYGRYYSTWWYDEYSVDTETGNAGQSLDHKGYLGNPSGQAYNVDNTNQKLADSLTTDYLSAQQNVWRRDFENGIVLVNPTGSSKTVSLGGAYRKINGTIDPSVNDGSQVSQITLASKSGIILLK
jgi:hypothetical protein